MKPSKAIVLGNVVWIGYCWLGLVNKLPAPLQLFVPWIFFLGLLVYFPYSLKIIGKNISTNTGRILLFFGWLIWIIAIFIGILGVWFFTGVGCAGTSSHIICKLFY